jgi:hypothetical protein
MRILFSLGNFGFLRNFEHAIGALAARGHDIHLVAERKDSVGGTKTIDNLLRAHPERITYSYAPARKDAFWQPLASQLRLALDYWRYLDPRWDESPSLRARGEREAPAAAAHLARLPLVGSRAALRVWKAMARSAERALPPPRSVEDFLREQRPDLLLVTPLLYFGSQQVDYVRAAHALGIRTVLGVGSWDHLTTKGLIHEAPDRVVVWNEMQRTEAAELHAIPAGRVTVTGAQAYDHWFTQQPSTSREAFAARMGVPSDRPLVLYLCSSPFITPYEVGFVRRWIDAIRSAQDPVLRSASILIRPHPQNAAQWAEFDPALFDAVAVWPRAGANPVDADARAEYFDSMYHAAAVVGVNTSALIESGIVGRPVYTVLTSDFAGQQEGTLHFRHLENVNGGLLHVASTLEEHAAQLASALHRAPDASKSRAFVEAFVRPVGLTTSAAQRFADAIEVEATQPVPARRRRSFLAPPWRLLLYPAAAAARLAASRRRERRRERPAAEEKKRFLFVLASPEFLRYYDTTMRLIAARGHHVSVAVSWLRERKHARLEGLLDDESINVVGLVPQRTGVWKGTARAVRATMDFVRYLDPRFANTRLLRERVYRKVLPLYMHWLDRFEVLSDRRRNQVMKALAAIERAIPVYTPVRTLLEEQRPDVVLVSPLVDAASEQVDMVRAAQSLGIPAVAGIASWDNLTNKGHLRVQPDLVTVWNDIQRREAIELHGVPSDRIAVTGAQLFDRWFERTPSVERDAFCVQAGLPDARPFVLFTGSSVFIAPSPAEVPFVRRVIEAMRASDDPTLRDVAVLVRPHPFNGHAWATADFSDLGPVAIWPKGVYTPAAEHARTSFFDSLYYSDAVVGINTSAMIEACILRKPVFSILAPEFAGTQEGTLHFRHLLPENGGFLQVSHSVEEHVAQLGAILRDPEPARAQTERFVRSFLRPQGLTVPCTPILADVLVRAAATRREPVRETSGIRALRVMLLPVAVVIGWLDAIAAFQPRRFLYEAQFQAKRTGRIAFKHVVGRPKTAIKRVSVGSFRKARRAAQLAPRVVSWPVRRALRLARLARYHVAVKIRGEALDASETSESNR